MISEYYSQGPDDLTYDPNYYKYDQYGNNPMAAYAPVGIIAMRSAVELSAIVNDFLVERRQAYLESEPDTVISPGFLRSDYTVPVNTFRFSSGEGKAVVERTVRGHDLFIICDPTNYSVTYNIRGHVNHRRNARESLDCAYMLEELSNLGVANLITFDAHDDRVANAVPTFGFESVPSVYQVLKALNRLYPEIIQDRSNLMIISPDEGAISRSMYYAAVLGVPLGTFYKRRDYTTIKNGRNPIMAHEFLGDAVEGKDVLIVDDMISSGDSMLELARQLKERKANRIFCAATFGLFTEGIKSFDRAYKEGFIDRIFCTNLIHREASLLEAPWYVDVNMGKFVALLIDAINHNASLSSLVDPAVKIRKLLG